MKAYPIPPRIAADLERVEESITVSLDAYNGQLHKPAVHTSAAGGKRLRPALVLMAGQAGVYEYERLKPVALCAELLHTATLVHDDVLDQADQRRGRDTVNARWDENIAVATGNMLLAEAFIALCDRSNGEVMAGMTECATLLSRGELMQQRALRDASLTVEAYVHRICYKTASLFASCCEFGARTAGATSSDVKAMKQYGECLGLAFQVFDDILDITAEEATLGKPIGGDIREGTVTLPVIYALAADGDGLLRDTIEHNGPKSDSDILAAMDTIKNAGGVELAKRDARAYVDNAFAAIENVSKKALKQELTQIGEFVIDRYN